MQILFVDTETTGTPKNYQASMKDLDNWPRIIQLAWQVATLDETLVCDHRYLIQPDGWDVPNEKFWIDNGFSTEKCMMDGRPMDKILDLFISYVDECDFMVAHNINFDYPIIGAEMIRYKRRASRKLKRICTMEHGTELCRIPGKKGYKWPKLAELHQFLFNCSFQGAHDAGSDVSACRKCFFELLRRGVISFQHIQIA